MTENTPVGAATTPSNGTAMRSEIAQTRPKFSAQDVAAVRSRDDLVTQVQSKYQLERVQAQKDFDAFTKGRQL